MQEDIFGNIALSCAYEKCRAQEEIVPEHFFGIHLSGETHVETADRSVTYKEGSIILARKNQLLRSTKTPGQNGEFKSVAILLNETILRKYAAAHKIDEQERYTGESIVEIRPDPFMTGYFASLLPYADSAAKKSNPLSDLKFFEAIELLLRQNPSLRSFLFCFDVPHKINLEQFMLQNYKFNVPLAKFAILTGRSLATFKRDFKATFNQSPRQWLQEQRLSEAYHLITTKRQKPSDIYLNIGFENLTHFYFSFKQKYGATPAEFK